MGRYQLHLWLMLILVGPQLNSFVRSFSTQYRGNARHPTQAGHCYYEELEVAVPINDTVFPMNHKHFCAKITCRDDYVLMIRHCERIQLADGCHFTESDYSLPYPDCCAQRICENSTG